MDEKKVVLPAIKTTSDIVSFFEAAGFEVRKVEGRNNSHFVIEIYKYEGNRNEESFVFSC